MTLLQHIEACIIDKTVYFNDYVTDPSDENIQHRVPRSGKAISITECGLVRVITADIGAVHIRMADLTLGKYAPMILNDDNH